MHSPNGKHVILECNRTAGKLKIAYLVWDWRASSIVAEIPAETAASTFAVNVDGTELALAFNDGTLGRFHALPDGRPIRAVTMRTGVKSVQYSPNGSQVAIHRGTQQIEICNLTDGIVAMTLSTPGGTGIKCLSWSPDGKLIAAGCQTTIALTSGTPRMDNWLPIWSAIKRKLLESTLLQVRMGRDIRLGWFGALLEPDHGDTTAELSR